MVVTAGPAGQDATEREALLSLARTQDGIVNRNQLLALGISPRTISRWLLSGLLVGVFSGSYATGVGVLHFPGLCMAASLTGPDGSILSHHSAAALHRLVRPPSFVEVIRPVGHTRSPLPDRRPAGPTSGWTLVVHRSRDLPEDEITVVNGIRVTTAPRTLLDLAATESLPRLRSMVAAGERERVWRAAEVEQTGMRGRGWKGLAKYRAVLLTIDPGDVLTDSELEILFRQFCRDFQISLSGAKVNHPIGEFRIDCVWEGLKLIVEVDSWTWHQSREAFERDRRRDAINTSRGYRTVRITSRAMTERAAETADLLQKIKADRIRELYGERGPGAVMGETGFEPV